MRLTPDQILTAAEWLDVNEGEDGEATACHAVAAWLTALAVKRKTDSAVRSIARQTGRSLRESRVALKRGLERGLERSSQPCHD
jgi:hypothetical protein